MTLVILCATAGSALSQEPAAALPDTQAASLSVPTFPLEQLKAGMMGTGYTVIRGTNIESFDVEILELIPKGGFDGGPMILARFTGKVVDFSNGIAGGYSGSPVYIDGKLLGAVSMAMPFTDTHVGGITPISSMLRALPDHDEPDYSNNTVLPASTNNGQPLGKEGEDLEPDAAPPAQEAAQEAKPAEAQPTGESGEPTSITYFDDYAAAREFNEQSRELNLHRLGAVVMKTPVFFSGMAPGVREAFGEKFSAALGTNVEFMDRPMGKAAELGLLQLDSDAQDSGASGPGLLMLTKDSKPPLSPGDAIAVSLIQGDIEAYAIGTLTYSDNQGRFLCFGHPMLQSGNTNMPVGKAYVTWTFESLERAFKEGVRLDTVGTMTKDHAAACGGSFEVQPDLIPVRVKIKDIDQNSEATKRFKVIRHPDFTPLLIAMGMGQASMEVLDREPRGTMKISYHIEGVGLKEPLRRTNYYADDMDVVTNAAMEVAPISNLLETNIYRNVQVTKVEVLIEITRNRINASIDDAEIIWEKSSDTTGDELSTGPVSTESAPVEPQRVDANETAQKIRLQDQQPAPGGQTTTPAPGMPVPGAMPMPLDVPTFKPGDNIRVKVRLQPYRTDPVWREFKIAVPSDFPAGSTMIVVHGGGDLISFSELNGKGRSLFGMGPIIDVNEHDLDSVLTQIVEWPMNNELLITLVRPYDPAEAQQLGQQAEDGQQIEDKIDAKYQMEWVIYNGFMLPVNIVSGDIPSGDQLSMPGEESATGGAGGSEEPDEVPENGDSNEDDTDLPF